jgi:hypothetical protein
VVVQPEGADRQEGKQDDDVYGLPGGSGVSTRWSLRMTETLRAIQPRKGRDKAFSSGVNR